MTYWGWKSKQGCIPNLVTLLPGLCANHVSRHVDFKWCGKTLICIRRRSQRLKTCVWLQGRKRHVGSTPVSVTHAFENEHRVPTHEHTGWCRGGKSGTAGFWKSVHQGIRRGNHNEPVRRFYCPPFPSFPKVSTSRQYKNGDRVSCWHTQVLHCNLKLGRQ